MYTPKIVAFLDILGFGSLTKPTDGRRGGHDCLHRPTAQYVTLEKVEHKHNRVLFDIRLFSDCICLVSESSAHGAAAMLDSVAYLSLNFATKRIPLRGGVAVGRHFHSDHMIFREALVNAYSLESHVAKWPRTVVAADVVSLARETVLFSFGKIRMGTLSWTT